MSIKQGFSVKLGIVLVCIFSMMGCSKKISREEAFAEKLYPYLDVVFGEVSEDFLLHDLSYSIRIDEIASETNADGEIIFISDMLENFSPEEQYAITQEVSRLVFLQLTEGSENLSNIKIGELYLNLSHGLGYSVWQTPDGIEYISSYFSLAREGIEIYDNPVNDLELELEAALGMPYNEWLEKQEVEREGIIVASSEDEYWYALTAAQSLVKDELKAPSTARFPVSADNYLVVRDGDIWEVTGFVDAQNGFGATVREYWTATFALGETSGTQYKISNYEVVFY